MATTEEVKKMLQQGTSEDEIIKNLRDRGFSAKEISDALTQAKIKAAISEPEQEQQEPKSFVQESPSGMEGMQPSMLVQEEQPQQTEALYPQEQAPQEAFPSAVYPQQPESYQEGYEQYQPTGISTDTITEISEQVVAEKISELRKSLEKIIDFKTTIDAKMSYIDERLKRIEQIIDRLQLSILQKIGDYMVSVSDVKKELAETQKSFKSFLPKREKQKPAQKPQQQ